MKRTIPFRMPTLCLSLVLLVLGPLIWLSTRPNFSHAQVAPTPGAGGLNTEVTKVGNVYEITHGMRVGSNLFHSFETFSLGAVETAQFQTTNLATDITVGNMLGRVTGGTSSNILGAIDSATYYPNANLFLINPAGFLFGPNATVNVGGMVAFTSADYLRLQDIDGGNARIFHADPAQASLLTSAPVAAFGFLGSNPGAIAVQGSQFTVSEGQSISLVGGDITIEGATLGPNNIQPVQLSAPGGSIHFASAKSPGEFVAGTLDQALNVNGQSFANLGAIQISQKSVLDTSGDGGGTVVIRGGHFLLDDSTISANTIGPEVGPFVGQPGAGIDIQVAEDVVIQNGATVETNVGEKVAPGVGSGGVRVIAGRIEILGFVDFETETFLLSTIRSNVAPGSTGGSSGDIRLEGDSILINAGNLQTWAQVDEFGATEGGGGGNAGNIVVTAIQNLDLDFGTIESVSCCGASGNAGNIELTSTNGNISSANFSTVTTQARDSGGSAGRITVSAPNGDILLASITDIFNQTFQAGALGGIEFTANNLTLMGESGIGGDNLSPLLPGDIELTLSGSLNLRDNSFIRTVARGPVPAADLIITAHDISIDGGSFLTTETHSSGPGGQLKISTESLQLATGGQVRSGSTMGPVPGGPVIPSGVGGTIAIQGLASPATSVVIDGSGSGIFTNTEGTGTGGNIEISARSVTMTSGGTVSASSTGQIANPGDAGSIDITATNGFTMQNSAIKTQAGQGASGGNIKVTTAPSATVLLQNSMISASVADGRGGGGNISIDPQFVILQNSQILAQAAQGQGGAITITTNLFLPDANSIVNADSGNPALNGTVTIQSPNAPASGKIQPLGKTPLQATSLLNQPCAALAGGEFSSFTVAGRDSLPTEPGSWLASPLVTLNAGMGLGVKAEGVRPVVRNEEPESETAWLSLRQIAPAGFLTQAFAADWSANCQS